MKKKILIIIPGVPFPPINGHKLKIYNLIKILHKYFDLHLITISRGNLNKQERKFIQEYSYKNAHFKITFISSFVRITIAFLFSIIGWGGSIVFYNSYLPEIASPDKFDNLSAKGFTLGYIGSVLLLIQNLTMVLKPDWYGGISGDKASRISFLTVGIWWIIFAQIPFYYLPKSSKQQLIYKF